ncbi:hypothetical protein [Treponema bryantii]|uniref:hypothetical protein n=1 Tax=Treponema bryantii TaxID=163 RepID=UPI002B2D6465|nr:hypothetical protein TRBR_28740 [Treponema bryantii]
MEIKNADYSTIVRFGTVEDLCKKIQLNNEQLKDVIDIKTVNGASLLENAISQRKFDIARFLLMNNAKVNVVTNFGYNEFHILASNIRYEGAVEIGEILLKKDVSLIQKDNVFGNTAFFTLLLESYKVRTPEVMSFIEKCIVRIKDFDIKNNAGISIRNLIINNGWDNIKKKLENL